MDPHLVAITFDNNVVYTLANFTPEPVDDVISVKHEYVFDFESGDLVIFNGSEVCFVNSSIWGKLWNEHDKEEKESKEE